MFTETGSLKRLIKEAWKGAGLHIEHTAEGWLAMGGFWWELEIDDTQLSNKIKAQIVELIGELPERGEGYLYIKGHEPQSEIAGMTYHNRMAEYDKCSLTLRETNIIIKTENSTLSVLEHGGIKILVPEWATDLLHGEVDPDGETLPEDGRFDERNRYVIWRNDKMALAVWTREPRYAGEHNFLEAVQDCSLAWDFEED